MHCLHRTGWRSNKLSRRQRQCTRGGQSIAELIIAIAVGAAMVTVAITAIAPMLGVDTGTNRARIAGSLGKQLLDKVRSVAQSNWSDIYNLSKGSTNHYHVDSSGAVVSGDEQVTVSNVVYTRYFYVENVCRDDATGNITGVEGAGCAVNTHEDPSTQEVVVIYRWPPKDSEKRIAAYLFRLNNSAYVQTNWFGGDGETNPVTGPTSRFYAQTNIDFHSTPGSITLDTITSSSTPPAFGETNIDGLNPYYWGWNDLTGWIDFYNTKTVNVLSDRMTGYASSSAGYISFDCETAPTSTPNTFDNICNRSNYKVKNDGGGNLSGWAWNDTYGWISFCGTTGPGTADCPHTAVQYQVYLEPDPDDATKWHFRGWAWNDIAGWFSFNCEDYNSGCFPSDPNRHKVRTTWHPSVASGTLESSIFYIDDGAGGARTITLNSLMWKGSSGADTSVKFQIATSLNSSGPWNFTGPSGAGSYYIANPDTPITLTGYADVRYFRYKVVLESSDGVSTPRVDEVILNWSQ